MNATAVVAELESLGVEFRFGPEQPGEPYHLWCVFPSLPDRLQGWFAYVWAEYETNRQACDAEVMGRLSERCMF